MQSTTTVAVSGATFRPDDIVLLVECRAVPHAVIDVNESTMTMMMSTLWVTPVASVIKSVVFRSLLEVFYSSTTVLCRLSGDLCSPLRYLALPSAHTYLSDCCHPSNATAVKFQLSFGTVDIS